MKTATIFSKGMAWCVFSALQLLICGAAGETYGQGLSSGQRPKLAGGKQARQHMASVDVGDYYITPKGPRRLRRSVDHFAVRGPDALTTRNQAASLRAAHKEFLGAKEIPWGDQRVLLKRRDGTHARDDDPRHKLAALRDNATINVDPVFVEPDSGLLTVVESRIVVCLKDGGAARDYFGAAWGQVQVLPGTRDQFLVPVAGLNAEEVLARCVRLSEDAHVSWAEPSLRTEGVRSYTPNDTHFISQWHLGDSAAGSVRAQSAWDSFQGDGIIIAIIDDGVQTSHPDLLTVPGINVLTGTSNVNPVTAADSHGTAVAGVAAAVGNNALGVAGVAFRSRILPVKVVTGDTWATSDQLAAAFRYASGLVPGFEGAHVINCSLSLGNSTVLDSALTDATTLGRGGRGCPVFTPSGNDAASWAYYSFPIAAGTHTFKFEYKKDFFVSEGLDSVWLDDVYLPGTGTQVFEGSSFPPSGWTTGGNANWQESTQPEWAKGGGANGTQSARSGNISHSQTTWLQTTQTTASGTLEFYVLTSTEYFYDVFNFYIDGIWQKPYGSGYAFTDPGGIYTDSTITFPASHANTIAVGASTDANLRSEYSQFGAGLDFVAPSSGGSRGIWTTDRTGPDGYDTGDYTGEFGGTSASSPLAAGIGALVLGRNGTLSAAEVRDVLRRSCSKIGGVTYTGGVDGAGGWNKYYGYGKLMADLAVQEDGYVSLADAVDAPELPWTTGGNANWFGQMSTTHDGADAAQSGAITHSQQSWMQTTVTGPGEVSFWWKVSSEAACDFLRFYVASTQQQSVSGNVDWQQRSFSVPAGTHTLKWQFDKNSADLDPIGSDCGWVDQVLWVPGEPSPAAVYRFWSDRYRGHFFTISEAEKNNIVANLSRDWRYEGIAYYAFMTPGNSTVPLHRFWSDRYRGHFFTISEAEKNNIIANLSNDWRYEGVAYHVYPSAGTGRIPVYRFWSPRYKHHFFTISEAEKNNIIANLSRDWNYEGIVYHVCDSSQGARAGTSSSASKLATVQEFLGVVTAGDPGGIVDADELTGAGDGTAALSTFALPSVLPGEGAVSFPVSLPGASVSAYIYDFAADAWTNLLDHATTSTNAVLGSVKVDRDYLLEVWSEGPDGTEPQLVHQSHFLRSRFPPAAEAAAAVLVDLPEGVGLPTESIALPPCEGTLTVMLCSPDTGATETLLEITGGETIELQLPQWDRWHWLGAWRDSDGELVLSLWLRHSRE